MDDVRELKHRLERIERQYRRIKTAGLLALLFGGAVLLIAQSTPPVIQRDMVTPSARVTAERQTVEEKIRAQSFVLVDQAGKERASLVTDGTGAVFFVMFDKAGKPRADLQVSNFGPSLNFYDPNAKTRLVVGGTTLVASHVNINGQMEKNPASSIVMFDSAGQLIWRTP